MSWRNGVLDGLFGEGRAKAGYPTIRDTDHAKKVERTCWWGKESMKHVQNH